MFNNNHKYNKVKINKLYNRITNMIYNKDNYYNSKIYNYYSNYSNNKNNYKNYHNR